MKLTSTLRVIIFSALTLLSTAHTLYGTDYFLLTEIGSSAEVISIGGVEGFSDSANGVFENPAGLYSIDSGNISFFSTTFLDEFNFANVAIVSKTPWGKIGVGYYEAKVFGIPFTGENANREFFSISFFDYLNTITKASYQFSPEENLHLGISLVYYRSVLFDVVGSGINLDVGVANTQQLFDTNIELSVFARNIIPNSRVEFSSGENETLPFQLISAVKYTLYEQDLFHQVSWKNKQLLLASGIKLYPLENRMFSVGAGFKQFPVGNLTKSNVSLGLSLELDVFKIHYSFEKSDAVEFDNKSYFSLSVEF